MPEAKPDRLVIDTNIFVSLIISQRIDELVDLVADNDLVPYSCSELLQELENTLNKPGIKKYLKRPAGYYVSFVADLCQDVVIDKRFDRAADPDDNFLFDLAYTVKAYYIVTNERVLLNMKRVNRINVISYGQLKRLLAEK